VRQPRCSRRTPLGAPIRPASSPARQAHGRRQRTVAGESRRQSARIVCAWHGEPATAMPRPDRQEQRSTTHGLAPQALIKGRAGYADCSLLPVSPPSLSSGIDQLRLVAPLWISAEPSHGRGDARGARSVTYKTVRPVGVGLRGHREPGRVRFKGSRRDRFETSQNLKLRCCGLSAAPETAYD
jgi:hypothetical protein